MIDLANLSACTYINLSSNLITSVSNKPTNTDLDIYENRLNLTQQLALIAIGDGSTINFYDQKDSLGNYVPLSMTTWATMPSTRVGTVSNDFISTKDSNTVTFDLKDGSNVTIPHKRLTVTDFGGTSEEVFDTTTTTVNVSHSVPTSWQFRVQFRSNDVVKTFTLNNAQITSTPTFTHFPDLRTLNLKSNGADLELTLSGSFSTPIIIGNWIKNANVAIDVANSLFLRQDSDGFIFHIEEVNGVDTSAARTVKIDTVLVDVGVLDSVFTSITALAAKNVIITTSSFYLFEVKFSTNAQTVDFSFVGGAGGSPLIVEEIAGEYFNRGDGQNFVTNTSPASTFRIYHSDYDTVTQFLFNDCYLKYIRIATDTILGDFSGVPTFKYISLKNNEIETPLGPSIGWNTVSLRTSTSLKKWVINLENAFNSDPLSIQDTLENFSAITLTSGVHGLNEVHLDYPVMNLNDYKNLEPNTLERVVSLVETANWKTDAILLNTQPIFI